MPLIVPFTVDLGLYGQIFISLEFLRFLKSVKFRRQRLQRRNILRQLYSQHTTKATTTTSGSESLCSWSVTIGNYDIQFFLLLFSWSMLLPLDDDSDDEDNRRCCFIPSFIIIVVVAIVDDCNVVLLCCSLRIVVFLLVLLLSQFMLFLCSMLCTCGQRHLSCHL